MCNKNTLAGAKRTPKIVTECRQKSQDTQGNICYTISCQRRAGEHGVEQHWKDHPQAAAPLAEPIMNRRSAASMVIE